MIDRDIVRSGTTVPTVPFTAVCSCESLNFVFASVEPVTLRVFLSRIRSAISRGERDLSSHQMIIFARISSET